MSISIQHAQNDKVVVYHSEEWNKLTLQGYKTMWVIYSSKTCLMRKT